MNSGFFRAAYLIGDWIFLNLSIILANMVYLHSWSGDNRINSIYLIIYSNLAWLFLVIISNPYNVSRNWFLSKTLKSQLAFIFIHSLVVASLVFFFKRSYDPRQVLLIYLFFMPLFFLWKALLYYAGIQLSGNSQTRNFILIGTNNLSQEIRRYFLMNPHLNYRFHGYFNFEGDDSILEIRNRCLENGVNEIFCCTPEMDYSYRAQLIDFGLDALIQVKLIIDNPAGQHELIRLEKEDQILPDNIATIPLDIPRNQFLKRFFDIVFSLLVIIFILTWLIPLIAILIKIDSKGPVFFIQKRTGRNDERFDCFKFRTMILNKEADVRQAEKNDPRITRVGAVLRRTCLDEFPQFFNVLSGSMSVVGPRPFMIRHREEYAKLIEKFMGRHYVKPGVTGLAQCLGYRGEIKGLLDMENRVQLDRHYIETWTFWKDIKIIFLTIVSIVKGD